MAWKPPLASPVQEATMTNCPAGGPRCPEWLCDCFAAQFPDDPEEWGKLHPEFYAIGETDDDA
jgi:hypothetical protein